MAIKNKNARGQDDKVESSKIGDAIDQNPMLEIDFILECRPELDKISQLIDQLFNVGLEAKVQKFNKDIIFILIYCPIYLLRRRIKSSRAERLLFSVSKNTQDTSSDELRDLNKEITPSESLFEIQKLLFGNVYNNDCGIVLGSKKWKFITDAYPVQNWDFNKGLLSRWQQKWFLTESNLRFIRDHFGEKVALYFEFQQYFYKSLIYVALMGAAAYFLAPMPSILYIVGLSLWSIIFIENWKRREKYLAQSWGVKHCNSFSYKRAAFSGEYFQRNLLTNSMEPKFPLWKQILRSSLGVPLAIFGITSLLLVISAIFSTDIFFSEIYNGPFRKLFNFLPAILFSTVVPVVSGIYDQLSRRLTDYENHTTNYAYRSSLSLKTFVTVFLKSYLTLFLTLFVYNPFGDAVVHNFSERIKSSNSFASSKIVQRYASIQAYRINQERLRNMTIYFAVQGQMISFLMNSVLPILVQKFTVIGVLLGSRNKKADIPESCTDKEKDLLQGLEKEINLPALNMEDQFCKLITQFGYIVMFSPLWSLSPLAHLVNMFIELRSDAVKLCLTSKRPMVETTDSIGSWLETLQFLSWVASITVSSVYCFYRNDLANDSRTLQKVLITAFIAEHLYLGFKLAANRLSKIVSERNQDSSAEFELRRNLIMNDPDKSELLQYIGQPASIEIVKSVESESMRIEALQQLQDIQDQLEADHNIRSRKKTE